MRIMHKMPRVKLDPSESVLAVIDIQPVLTKTIEDADRVLQRSAFLLQIARLLEIPVLTTEQNPSRMGATHENLAEWVQDPSPFSKMTFSAVGSPEFLSALKATGRNKVVIVGMETHICVCHTACDLLDLGYEVVVCPDAVSSRNMERHKLGMERIRDAGAVPAHTESVAYEWLGSAENPAFKSALAIVKQFA